VVILITENHLITFWGGLQAAQADFGEYPHFSAFCWGIFCWRRLAGSGRPFPSPPPSHAGYLAKFQNISVPTP
jgi:hypothetical protein